MNESRYKKSAQGNSPPSDAAGSGDSARDETAVKARGTRQKIVAAALAEFATHGKEGARIDRIAEQAGVNKAMIYYHFDSKDKLYVEVLKSFYIDISRRIKIDVLKHNTLESALAALARIHADAVLENDHIVPLILREMASPHPEVLSAISEAFVSIGLPKRIFGLISEGIEDGSVRRIDPKHAMTSFISLSLGYLVVAPLADRVLGIENRRDFIKERPDHFVDIFLNGVKVKR